MKCIACGHELESSKFCPQCGTPVLPTSAASPTEQVPPAYPPQAGQAFPNYPPQNGQVPPAYPPQGGQAFPNYPPQNGQVPPIYPSQGSSSIKKRGGCLKVGLIVLGVFMVIGIIGGIAGGSSSSTGSSSILSSSSMREPMAPISSKPIAPSVMDDNLIVSEAPTANTPAKPTMTTSQEQAIKKANEYLAYTAFSLSGLIGQLEYEGFSNEDATFAVNNITVDWNEQAAQKAQDYLDYSAFSRQGLIDQLVFEGFTNEQAVYGVDAVGL